MTIQTNRKELYRALEAVSEGENFEIRSMGDDEEDWVSVYNPKFSPDNGENPFLVFRVMLDDTK